MTCVFHIATIANDLVMYEAMKKSFLRAGFDETRCRYTCLDNSVANVNDPYAAIRQLKKASTEPYLIVCHQDILVSGSDGFDALVARLEALSRQDPHWAIAGNAGFNEWFEHVVWINDPHHFRRWSGVLPERVHSLDENFLVIRTASAATTSEELKGFHLYATDLCLSAINNGENCYVIEFKITHLSPGNFSTEFENALARLKAKWSNSFWLTYIKPMGRVTLLTRMKWLDRLLTGTRLERWLLDTYYARRILTRAVSS